MVSLRRTGGRKSATVVGGASTPSNVTVPLTNRSGLVGSRQYPSIGTRYVRRVTVTELSTMSTPASGITIGAWSVGGMGTRAIVRSSWVTVSVPDRTLTGSSTIAFNVTGIRPWGTGKVRVAVPWSP